MFDEDLTTRINAKPKQNTAVKDMTVTVFDGDSAPKTFCLKDFKKDVIYFGRKDRNDIVLSSPLVSREHGRFRLIDGQWTIEDKCVYDERPSENGLIFND